MAKKKEIRLTELTEEEKLQNEIKKLTATENAKAQIQANQDLKVKLELRMYTEQPIHAKVYIMRKNPELCDYYGSVITGSSNFSYSGLVNNLEFNVELKDSADVKFALERFEELWAKAVQGRQLQ